MWKRKKNTRERLFWENLGDSDVTKWEIVNIEEKTSGMRCCCNQPIQAIYELRHIVSGDIKIIGRCCARRLSMGVSWRTKADYLANAMLMSNEKWESDMIKRLQDKLPMWGSKLIISNKQKAQLERITNHKWRGKVWENW